jgi:lipoic acid synthetase
MISTPEGKISHRKEENGGAKPPWLKVRFPSHRNYFLVSDILREHRLSTICQSAKCPNIAACWEQRTATFLILGEICTRNCAFCAVPKGNPLPPSDAEPEAIADAVDALGLKYAVVTSVTRDDLPDGGAVHFARTVRAIRKRRPESKVEVLVPDFKGDHKALEIVLSSGPDIFNHNLETAEALYPHIRRPKENYQRSRGILKAAAEKGARTKSGIMVGLGEKREEILETFSDLRRAGCGLLTIGQYLQPTRASVGVQKYYTPEEFEQLKNIALDFGFKEVESSPLARSSFRAHELYRAALGQDDRECVI